MQLLGGSGVVISRVQGSGFRVYGLPRGSRVVRGGVVIRITKDFSVIPAFAGLNMKALEV